jgi:hypothetical protein
MRAGFSVAMNWAELLHSINVTKPLKGDRVLVEKTWEGMPALEFRAPAPLVSIAPYPPDEASRFQFKKGKALSLKWTQTHALKPGSSWTFPFYFGLGPDEIGAFAVAREFQRMGWETVLLESLEWLKKRRRQTAEPALDRVMNTNAFFNRFFATGQTLDTEEVVCLTSRSPRYYVSGAYWDRDTLLWSFPSVLALDPEWARKVLGYCYGRQGKNFGVHSRYLSGTVLEPGFELDEFCAPIIALRAYLETTGDQGFLEEPGVRTFLDRFEKDLAKKKHPQVDLYQTWLLPSDDPWPQRYVIYDNVLVWRALRDLAAIRRMENDEVSAARLDHQESLVTQAILEHGLVQGPKGKMFAWSVDLDGGEKPMLYDEPPGSLLLLPHYGFCSVTDPVWMNTRDWIYSSNYPYSFAGKPFEEVGCGHAPHPWVLGAVNSLLAGEKGRALKFLSRAKMDNGIACESVDEHTGEVATGEAFATCAGFLAYGLWRAVGKAKR